MKRILSLFVLLAIPASLAIGARSFMGNLSDVDDGPHRPGSYTDCPPPVTVPTDPGNPGPGLSTESIGFGDPLTSTYFNGQLVVFNNFIELTFNRVLNVSSVTITNTSTGRTSGADFGGVWTNQVVVPSPSSNGLWDICVTADGVNYHAMVRIDCYQSMYVSPMD